DTLRTEYSREDLGKGVRGKHLEEYRAGTNLVLLSPEVAAIFPDDKSVNEALMSLVKVAEKVTAKRSAKSMPRAGALGAPRRAPA
ncbi:MAG TPA: hypothetical protein VGR07_01865, partial [Thermoanaerobaculia bacterium]|nr:hypothetical protein [Thermoanaerobaculia bacterium]